MKSNWIAVSAFLQAQVLVTDAQAFGLTDPRLCYLLDGILLIYAIIISALFIREKLPKSKPIEEEDTYSKINSNTREVYHHGKNLEAGGRRGQRPQDNNTVYQGLQADKMSDPYNQIGIKQQQQKKKGKGNETTYQGLNAAPRDTYDALQMMPLR
ncbi:T-cell surface glycoprotein CD3 zeta chain isoform X3 [Pyxicephalus adspersus]|uniref:T-cell surface glycoprotein CD3 zeta chain isoform X3 n=1 Tax=Pyxicephalus adspersus TaxID=30357 RepID=UPI003B59BB89